MSRPRWKRWVSTRRRLLTPFGVNFPQGFDPYLDSPIWGAASIGEVINQNAQQTDRLLRARRLDADQISLKQPET